jgi:hypothetical protein
MELEMGDRSSLAETLSADDWIKGRNERQK